MTLQQALADRLQNAPDTRALTFPDARGVCDWITFGELHQQAAARAHLLAEMGLRPGDVCMFVLGSDRACLLAVLGCLLAGGVPVLVAPPIVRGLHSNLIEVMRHVARKTGARLAVVEDGAEGAVPEEGPRAIPISTLNQGGDAALAPLHLPQTEDIAAMQLTSGTTGLPRVCMWKQRGVLASLDGMEKAMDLSPADVFVNWTPLYHDMGLVNNFLLCLAKSIPLVWLQATDFVKKPARWLAALHTSGATTTWSPNFGFAMAAARVTDAEMEGVRLDSVRGFWNAAERIHAETLTLFRERFTPFGLQPGALKTNFGCAENVGGATFTKPDEAPVIERLDRAALHDESFARVAPDGAPDESTVSVVSTGLPCPGMTIRIVDEHGNELPEGSVGEVSINTPSRMVGYLDDPDETAFAVRGEWLHTGDVGYLRNGELFWTGRLRERMNLNGKKYDPSDFERVLLNVEGLREGCFAAFGVDDPKRGSQRLVIISEARDGAPLAPEQIIAKLRREIAGTMGISVSEILLLPQGVMSKTSSGKRRHRFYRELFTRGELEPLASWREQGL
jgi:acyl-CoA synthetase (AMP-forming)/AMP-acid ligase II